MKKLSKLIESDLDKAELVLAAKNLSQNVQDMTEKVAKMRVDDLMPLTDRIKDVFGQSEGEKYQNTMDEVLENVQDVLTEAKDAMDRQAAILNGDVQDNDEMSMDVDYDDDMSMDVPDDETEEDPFGSVDANIGGDEPLGRAAKESVSLENVKRLKESIKLLQKKLKSVKK